MDDAQLIDKWLARKDREALNRLLQRYLGPIRRFVSDMLLDETAVDDLTQDILLRAIRGMPMFERRAKFSTWLFQVARNAVYTHLERHPRRKFETNSDMSSRWNGRQDSPDQELMSQETITQIANALGQLTPKLRAAIVLVGLHGKSAAEAARIEGCADATIYSRLHEARKQLKARLGDLS